MYVLSIHVKDVHGACFFPPDTYVPDDNIIDVTLVAFDLSF